ncbi:hypothetical protein DDZ18_10730 [Marinicauda salina]|uniref:Uncharacterized protein n=1 Tax=Marinicauda salina TaxID=2135793 RepID=A0A2U2BRN2_9PROT|nr:hypothetical protein DDZ18_10730 [Marinicauda salina]
MSEGPRETRNRGDHVHADHIAIRGAPGAGDRGGGDAGGLRHAGGARRLRGGAGHRRGARARAHRRGAGERRLPLSSADRLPHPQGAAMRAGRAPPARRHWRRGRDPRLAELGRGRQQPAGRMTARRRFVSGGG